MRLKVTHIIILILVAVIIILSKCSSNKIEGLRADINKTKIKNDSLRKDKDGVYKKYVADSITKKELKKKVKELEIKANKPLIVERVVFKPMDIEKEPEVISHTGDTLMVTDYYPKKEDYFIRYDLQIKDSTYSKSKFSFSDIKVGIVVDEVEDGLYETKIKAPDFIKVGSVDVHMLPETTQELKPDNFGFLLGAGIGQDYLNNTKYLKLGTGIRFKKTYLQIQATTNQSVDLTLTYEF